MSDEINMTISIPTDDDGYVLLQCEHCGTYFKGMPSDLKDDDVLNIFCPSCGLISENYVTDDVLELAPIRSGIEAMEICNFPCCKRTAKIKPLLKMTGAYCPFCGVKNCEIE